MPPGQLAAILFGQMLLDQIAHVGEGRKMHDGGDGQRARQWARPVGTGHGTILYNSTKGLSERYAFTAGSRVTNGRDANGKE
jgi:hypothetical protein